MRWKISILIFMALWLAACDFNGNSQTEAIVERVEIRTLPGNPPTYAAVVSGSLPDSCTRLGRTRQVKSRNTIKITLNTTQRAGSSCDPISKPFREVVPLEVDGLSAGSYGVEVNGVTTSLTLTEDH